MNLILLIDKIRKVSRALGTILLHAITPNYLGIINRLWRRISPISSASGRNGDSRSWWTRCWTTPQKMKLCWLTPNWTGSHRILWYKTRGSSKQWRTSWKVSYFVVLNRCPNAVLCNTKRWNCPSVLRCSKIRENDVLLWLRKINYDDLCKTKFEFTDNFVCRKRPTSKSAGGNRLEGRYDSELVGRVAKNARKRRQNYNWYDCWQGKTIFI